MISKILKMGGCSNVNEFYRKYPTEDSFLEAFPQARPLLEQMKMGGTPEAFPQQPSENQFFNYGNPTPNMPRLFDGGGELYASGGSNTSIKKKNKRELEKVESQYLLAYASMQGWDESKVKEFVAQYALLDKKKKSKMLSEVQMIVDQQIAAQQQAQQQQAAAQQQEAMAQQKQQSVPEQVAEAYGAETVAANQQYTTPTMQFGGSNPFVDNKLQKFTRRNGGGLMAFQGDRDSSQVPPQAADLNFDASSNGQGAWETYREFMPGKTGFSDVLYGVAGATGAAALGAPVYNYGSRAVGRSIFDIDPELYNRGVQRLQDFSKIAIQQGITVDPQGKWFADMLKMSEIVDPTTGTTLQMTNLDVNKLLKAYGITPEEFARSLTDKSLMTADQFKEIEQNIWFGQKRGAYEKALMDKTKNWLKPDASPEMKAKLARFINENSMVATLMENEKPGAAANFLKAIRTPKALDLGTAQIVKQAENMGWFQKAIRASGLEGGGNRFKNLLKILGNKKTLLIAAGSAGAGLLTDYLTSDEGVKEITEQAKNMSETASDVNQSSQVFDNTLNAPGSMSPTSLPGNRPGWRSGMTQSELQQAIQSGNVNINQATQLMENPYGDPAYPGIIVPAPGDTIPVGPFRVGGTSPMNYGQMVAVMAKGGVSSPGMNTTDSQVENVRNKTKNFMFVNNEISRLLPDEDTQDLEVNRLGGLKKKAPLIRYQQNLFSGMSGQTNEGYGMGLSEIMTDAASVQAEMAARDATGQSLQTGDLTDYEKNKFADLSVGSGANPSDPNPGEMGPPKPDYVLDRELAEEQMANMPGSTAKLHYNEEGEYIPAMDQRRKEKESARMAAESCPDGYEYDPRQQRCVPEGTKSKTKAGEFLSKVKSSWNSNTREEKVNKIFNTADWIIGSKEASIQNKLMKQAQEDAINMQNMAVAPTYQGFHMTNQLADEPPTKKGYGKKTATQFSGYNPFYSVARKGAEVSNNSMDLYLTDEEILEIKRRGGHITYLD